MLQVQGAADGPLAGVALGEARAEICRIDASAKVKAAHGLSAEDQLGPNYVAPVLPAASGPFLYVDAKAVPDKLLETIPDIVRRHLEQAGVPDAVVVSPPLGGTLEYLSSYPNAVLLRLYPSWTFSRERRRWRLPPEWLEEVAAWVEGGLDGHDELLVAVDQMEFSLALGELAFFLEQCQHVGPSGCDVVGAVSRIAPPAVRWGRGVPEEAVRDDALRRLGPRLRMAKACFGVGVPNLVLAAGGPELDAEALADELERLKAVARRLAPGVAYAYATAKQRLTLQSTEKGGWSQAAPQAAPAGVCEFVAFDAFPYQVLGPGHVKQLGGVPDNAKPIAGNRIELELTEPITGPPEVKRVAWGALGPCLAREGEAVALAEARRGTGAVPGDPPAGAFGAGDVASRDEPPFVTQGRAHAEAISPWQSRLHELAPSVGLTLYLPRGAAPNAQAPRAPLSMLEPVCDWVLGEGEGELWAMLGYARFQIAPGDAPELLAYADGTQQCVYIAIDPDGLLRYAAVGHGTLRLIGGMPAGRYLLSGPDAYQPAIALADGLKRVARAAAPSIVYGHLRFEVVAAGAAADAWPWESVEGAEPEWRVEKVCDELVFDGFHYQVLGPGHLERLGGIPKGGTPLPGGRAELEVGRPHEWLPLTQAQGRKVLAACLITADEERRLERKAGIARGLAAAGAPQPLAALPHDGGRLDELPRVPQAVVARLHRRPIRRRRLLSDPCIEAVLGWLLEGIDEEQSVLVAVDGGLQTSLPAKHVQRLLELSHRRVPETLLTVSGKLDGRLRGVNWCLGADEPTVTVGFGGPAATEPEMLAAIGALKLLCRRVAPELCYAFVSIDATFEAFAAPYHFTDEYTAYLEGDGRIHWADSRWHDHVLDAFHHQLLGPAHLERLEGLPEGAVALGEHAELSLGEARDWLIRHTPGADPDAARAARAKGQRLLTNCLLEEAKR